MRYIDRNTLLTINRLTIERHGGNFVPPDNLLNPNPLEYLLDSVKAKLFGVPLYPTASDKAAVYMFTIISNHIFQDGNKRTGLEAALLFLESNGYGLDHNLERAGITSDQYPGHVDNREDHIISFTLSVAAGHVSLEACRAWFAANIVPVNTTG